MARIPLAILLAVLATLAIASVPSFCKCICGKESYIIELGTNNNKNPQPPPPAPKPSSSTSTSPSTTTMTAITTLTKDQLLTPRESSTSCKQCNRAFCLSYNLPICKDAEEKDIKTTCFQRDSRKDQGRGKERPYTEWEEQEEVLGGLGLHMTKVTTGSATAIESPHCAGLLGFKLEEARRLGYEV
ncbi:hypothetical protein N657DRAFT_703382 [Parathielavia appendiculata]|uniref:Uncharacterized protein n=1 Tax=Parathielavia appendiculata TaxID=2587402 RepID=A0AAN6Z6F9_9PEZI|nr:hypothetical protein N657DRAFT_703382 [Parathielavia appendiculata]